MKQLFYFLFLTVLLSACKKNETIPDQPSIEFISFTNYNNDSADCVINFKDGDGDLGLLDNDSTSPPDLQLKYLYKDANGNFLPYDASFGTPEFDTLFYTYRVPNITPENGGSLEGDVTIKLRATPIYFPTHEVVKFEIQMTDRAGNKSNIVSTSEIVL